jgi:hypothetical protein
MLGKGLSSGFDGFVHFTMKLKPIEIPSACSFFNFSQQVDRFGLVARFAGVIDGYHHLDIYCDQVSITLHQPSAFHSLPWDLHYHSSSKK